MKKNIVLFFCAFFPQSTSHVLGDRHAIASFSIPGILRHSFVEQEG